jgi:hypothetical protein
MIEAQGGVWLTSKSGVRGLFVDDGHGGIEAVAFRVERPEYKPLMDLEGETLELVTEILPEEAEKAIKKAFSGTVEGTKIR